MAERHTYMQYVTNRATTAEARAEAAERRLAAIQEGRPYDDCAGDCGPRGYGSHPTYYCCDGDYDQRRRAEAAEARVEQLEAALSEVAEYTAKAQHAEQLDGIGHKFLRQIELQLRAALKGKSVNS